MPYIWAGRTDATVNRKLARGTNNLTSG